MITVISWVVFGLFVGALGRILVPGRQRIGVLWTIGIGIVGAIAGGAIADALLGDDDGDFDFPTLVAAVIVAAFLVAIAASLTERGRGRGEREE